MRDATYPLLSLPAFCFLAEPNPDLYELLHVLATSGLTERDVCVQRGTVIVVVVLVRPCGWQLLASVSQDNITLAGMWSLALHGMLEG